MRYLQELRPQIDFGLGKTNLRVRRNTPVTVWLSVLYSASAYEFELLLPGASVSKITNYQYRVVMDAPGSHSLQLAVTVKATGKKLLSDPIFLTIY